MKGIVSEEENVVVLYVDGKASTKYPAMVDAKDDVERLKKKFPDKKIELKREVRGGHGGNEKIDEADPCWKGYKQVGMKKKGKKEVPNCVPVKEEQIDEISKDKVGRYLNRTLDKSIRHGAQLANAPDFGKRMEVGHQISNRRKGVATGVDKLLGKAKVPATTNEAAFEKDLEDNEPRIVTGVYGAKSKEFRKKFANQRAQDRFFDHPDNEGNYEIQQVKKANVSESVIISTTQNGNPKNPQVAVLGGAGSYSYENLKKKALGEAKQLAQDIQNGEYKNSAYNVKQLANTLNTIVAAEEEMEKLYFGEDRRMNDTFARIDRLSGNKPSSLSQRTHSRELDQRLRQGDDAVKNNLKQFKEESEIDESGVKYVVRSKDGVERGYSDPNSIGAQNWRDSYQRKEKPFKPEKIKKPSLDSIWQRVEHAISNYFPDGDPTDYLNPYMQKTGINWDDITRAAKKQGYKDLWDYWNTLAQDIENDQYSDWHSMASKRPAEPVNPLAKDAGDIQYRNIAAKAPSRMKVPFMEDDLEEVADTQTDLNKTGGFITPEHDNAYSQLKKVAPKLYNFIRNEAPVPLDPVLTLKMFGQIRNENQVLQMMKQHLQQDTRKMYGDKHPSLAESLKRFWNNMISESKKIKGADGKACWKGYRYAGTEKGKDNCVPVKKESSIMKGLTK